METNADKATANSLKRAFVAVAGASVVAVRLPLASLTGLEPDSWRRALGLGLKSDGTKFGLSAFGLDLFSNAPRGDDAPPTRAEAEAQFARRWSDFVRNEPEGRWVLKHREHHVERVQGEGETVTARFSEEGELEGIELLNTPGSEQGREIEEAFRLAHGATRMLSERERPRALLRAVKTFIPGGGPAPRLEKVSAASQITFEIMPPGDERFLPPDWRRRRPVGCGVFNIVARLAANFRSVDVWLQIHHVATDGAPVQEMLVRLEKSWGILHAPLFPPDNPAAAPRVVCVQPSAADRPLSEVVDFINFAPLLAWREAMNKRHREKIGGPAPVVCAVMWHLARQPEFAGRKFSTAVDVPAAGRHARAVAMVGIRPADYDSRPDGFAEFAREYLQLLEKARNRSSAGWRLLRQLALLPPCLAGMALTMDAERGRRVFGTIGMSMLKDAKVFSAPMEDAGWYDGFLAIGNVSLPSRGGGTVAAITARGAAETVCRYPQAIRRAIQQCSASDRI